MANTVGENNSRLEQPNDAVPMESMAQETVLSGDAANAVDVSGATTAERLSASNSAPADDKQSTTATTLAGNAAATEFSEKDTEDLAPVPPTKERSDSILAIGPAQDDIQAAPSPGDGGPVCNITLLLTSGSRHPYKIDARYLSRRNVAIPEETESGQPDPFSISIYTLKELILREWRSDWEAKPASPSSIRLIHFGKLLDDKEQLRSKSCTRAQSLRDEVRLTYSPEYQFSTESPNVVHMSIRPQDLDEEEPKSGSKSLAAGGGDGQRSRPGGMCCIIL